MSRDGSQRKREALREQGALHAHPDRVVDPLFEDGGFFDPEKFEKYPFIFHYEFVLRYSRLRRGKM